MSGRQQRTRRPWTEAEIADLKTTWHARGPMKAVTFDRALADKLNLSLGSVEYMRRSLGLRSAKCNHLPPPVRVCHARRVDVCEGLPGEEQGGGPMCCNCIEGFDLPDIRVVLEDS